MMGGGNVLVLRMGALVRLVCSLAMVISILRVYGFGVVTWVGFSIVVGKVVGKVERLLVTLLVTNIQAIVGKKVLIWASHYKS